MWILIKRNNVILNIMYIVTNFNLGTIKQSSHVIGDK